MIKVNDNYVGAADLLRQLEDGEIDALDLMIAIKRLEIEIESVKSVAKEKATDEALKYGQKTFDKNGAKIEVAELGVSYSYDSCCYPEWERLKTSEASVKEKIKSSELWLKSLKGKTEYIDPETGEMCDVFPPQKTSTTGIKITLKK